MPAGDVHRTGDIALQQGDERVRHVLDEQVVTDLTAVGAASRLIGEDRADDRRHKTIWMLVWTVEEEHAAPGTAEAAAGRQLRRQQLQRVLADSVCRVLPARRVILREPSPVPVVLETGTGRDHATTARGGKGAEQAHAGINPGEVVRRERPPPGSDVPREMEQMGRTDIGEESVGA